MVAPANGRIVPVGTSGGTGRGSCGTAGVRRVVLAPSRAKARKSGVAGVDVKNMRSPMGLVLDGGRRATPLSDTWRRPLPKRNPSVLAATRPELRQRSRWDLPLQ